MRISLLGGPGAGKGSLATMCERRLRLTAISTGSIFRQEIARKTTLGRRVQRYVSKGKLVPDALVVQVMTGRLHVSGRSRGFLLDGFPRTIGQAKGLDAVMRRQGRPLDAAVQLTSPQALLVRRLSGRRICDRCGVNYHIRTMRPKRAGRCDHCRGRLIIRHDDRPSTIKNRLAVDRAQTKPLLAYYARQRKLRRIDGAGTIHQVYRRFVALCRAEGWMRA